MSSAATCAHAGPALPLLSCCDLEEPINYLVLLFPCNVQENQEPAWPEVIAIASLTPCCCTEACNLFLLLHKTASPAPLLHMETSKLRSWVVWRADQPFRYRTASLQGSSGFFKETKLLEDQINAWALLQKVLLHLWLSSSGMIFTQSLLFHSLPALTCVLMSFLLWPPFCLQACRLWMQSNCFDPKFQDRVLCWEAFLLGRAKGRTKPSLFWTIWSGINV